jgi:hypothetical protein
MLRAKKIHIRRLEDLAMLSSKLLRSIAEILVFAFLLNLSPLTSNMFAATCTGSDPCNACKNCKYCKHCAKEGGKCGVCK